jgi:hypothetical protein
VPISGIGAISGVVCLSDLGDVAGFGVPILGLLALALTLPFFLRIRSPDDPITRSPDFCTPTPLPFIPEK